MSIGFHLYWWVLMSREFDGLRKCNGASTFRLRRAAARDGLAQVPVARPGVEWRATSMKVGTTRSPSYYDGVAGSPLR
jgi:hypothetical protein